MYCVIAKLLRESNIYFHALLYVLRKPNQVILNQNEILFESIINHPMSYFIQALLKSLERNE